MKLYKFRSLGNQTDFNYAKTILTTGKFWCSRFMELNDPMEGIFTTKNIESISSIFSEKNKYVICSFSDDEAFKRPPMWGYYANGFKGIAIEVEIKKCIYPVKYINTILHLEKLSFNNRIKKILTSKLDSWTHEGEYRFLKKLKPNLRSIGKITAVYFGEPFGGVYNREQVYKESQSLQCYRCFAEKLLQCTRDVDFYSVKIHEGKVLPGDLIEKKHSYSPRSLNGAKQTRTD